MKARPAILSKILLKTTLFVLPLFSLQTARPQSVPLINAFAHNDYCHPHPLFDALNSGYTNVEADIFLVNGNLVVAHINPFFKGNRTLESLYLKPLAARIAANGGQVYKGYNTPVILMIDIKTGADNTYSALKVLLEKYKGMLSCYDHGKILRGAATVVLSGHKPYQMIKGEEKRYAFIDEDLRRTYSDTAAVEVYKMASCKYSKLMQWRGEGDIPPAEEANLRAYVKIAHKYGKKVRLWASPENYIVWNELLNCGVDLINTDKLEMLKSYLLKRTNSFANSGSADVPDISKGIIKF